jgi:hypothetical protein
MYEFSNPETRQKQFSAAYEAVQSAGGDPFGGAPRQAAKALRNAAAALDAMDKGNGGGGGSPQGPFAGSGGAGANPGRR